MKILKLLSYLTLALATLVTTADAACTGVMQPQYSMYRTITITASGPLPHQAALAQAQFILAKAAFLPPPVTKYQLNETVVVSGTTSIQNSSGCNLTGVLHTPQIWQQHFGSTLLQNNGAGVAPTAQMNYSVTNTFPTGLSGNGQLPGQTMPGDTQTVVHCSAVGTLALSVWNDAEAEFAITYSHTVGTPACAAGYCLWSLTPWCTASTTPPDFDPSVAGFPQYNPPSAVIVGVAFCFKTNTYNARWTCLPGFYKNTTLIGASSQGACTFTPPGI